MIDVAVVGTGNISSAHLGAYAQFPERCRVVALCDLKPDKAEAKAAEFGLDVPVFADAATMAAEVGLDLVSLATPPDTHAPLAVLFLEAGVDVLVEKPMAPSLEECDRMLAAAEASGRLLSVVAQNRFRDDTSLLHAVLDRGLLGPLSHVQVNSLWWRGLPYYDLWWRGTWASEGGGCTLNHAIHHLDLLCWLMGVPDSLVAMLTNAAHENSEVEDLSVAVLRYGRALAQVTSSVVHHGEEAGIVLHGRDASVAQPWRAVAELTQPNGFPTTGGNPELVRRLEELRASRAPLAHTGHAGQVDDVLAAVEEGRPPAITGHDGRNAVELVTAIYRSGIENAVVSLPIAPDDPYYRSGTLEQRAPRYYPKGASVDGLAGDITVGVRE